MEKQELLSLLSKFDQSHLLSFWDELSDSDRQNLTDDICRIDFKDLKESFERTRDLTILKSNECGMKPVPNELKGSYLTSSKTQLESYENCGLKEISEGNVAVLLLAGGQGTRLGVSYPKGMYSVGLPSGKTLFQIQAERLIRVQRLAADNYPGSKCVIPWFIMTSENTKTIIVQFFEEKKFFGLNKSDVIFFEQGNLPCLDKEGKVILEQKFKVSQSPDGNGGLYRALLKSNVLDQMRERNIKSIHAYCVDNILVRIADPVFVGFCVEKGYDCAAKVVRKTQPNESVGVICEVDGNYQVVEYSEISEVNRGLRDEHGELVYNAANICNHFFSFEFLNDVCTHYNSQLIYHVAEKKIPYVDQDGIVRKPQHKNGIKLEKFIFDVFPFSK